MAIFYVDHENGDDDNGGDSFHITLSGISGYTNGTPNFFSQEADFTSIASGRYINITGKGTYIISGAINSTGMILLPMVGQSVPTIGTGVWRLGGRWKTLVTGASTARLQAGDVVRVMASPYQTSLGQSGTWTFASKDVVLTSGVIQPIENCETLWTTTGANIITTGRMPATNVKEGTGCLRVTITGAYQTGQIAYKTLPSPLDLSNYQQVSYWLASDNLNSGNLTIRLCSDSVGLTTVNSIPVPMCTGAIAQIPVVYDYGVALGSNINSVAIFAEDTTPRPRPCAFLMDHIIACKAPSQPDSLNLTSLIGKNKTNESWYGIQSFSGNVVKLDNHPNCQARLGLGYGGISETCETWKRETLGTDLKAFSASVIGDSFSVTQDNSCFYFGGWDRTGMAVRTGETWFDGQNGKGVGLWVGGNTNNIENISFVRYNFGTVSNAGRYCFFKNVHFNNHTGPGVSIVTSNTGPNSGSLFACNNGTNGIALNQAFDWILWNPITLSNSGYGLAVSSNYKVHSGYSMNNGTYGINQTNVHGHADIFDFTMSGNQLASMFAGYGDIHLKNCIMGDTIEVASAGVHNTSRIISVNHDNTPNNHYIFYFAGLAQTETDIVNTLGGLSWKISPLISTWEGSIPLPFSVATVAVESGSPVTATVWAYRNGSNLQAKFIVKSGHLAGLNQDTGVFCTGLNSWEPLRITFTPQERGVIEYKMEVFGSTTQSVYIDDFSVTQ